MLYNVRLDGGQFAHGFHYLGAHLRGAEPRLAGTREIAGSMAGGKRRIDGRLDAGGLAFEAE